MIRVIHLPATGRQVTLGQYVRAIKTAKANPDCTFKHGLTCWYPCTGSDIVRQFRSGLHDRINQAIPATRRGISKTA